MKNSVLNEEVNEIVNQNFRQAKAIEYKNKRRLLEVNPKLDDEKSADYLSALSTYF